MSKTDKTRPVSVKVYDDPNWLTEHHDHRLGDCDLGPKPTRRTELRWYGSGSAGKQNDGSAQPRCFWWFSSSFWHQPTNGCGCPMCTGQDERKAERRRTRRAGRILAQRERAQARVIAAGVVTTLTDVDDLDHLDDAWYDPWVEEFHNGIEAEARDNARIADRLGLPEGSLVVEVGYPEDFRFEFTETDDGWDICGDAPDLVATVLHNDGRRETVTIPAELAD